MFNLLKDYPCFCLPKGFSGNLCEIKADYCHRVVNGYQQENPWQNDAVIKLNNFLQKKI